MNSKKIKYNIITFIVIVDQTFLVLKKLILMTYNRLLKLINKPLLFYFKKRFIKDLIIRNCLTVYNLIVVK